MSRPIGCSQVRSPGGETLEGYSENVDSSIIRNPSAEPLQCSNRVIDRRQNSRAAIRLWKIGGRSADRPTWLLATVVGKSDRELKFPLLIEVVLGSTGDNTEIKTYLG